MMTCRSNAFVNIDSRLFEHVLFLNVVVEMNNLQRLL